MTRNTILSQDEAAAKASAHHGYVLISKYAGMKNARKALFLCPKHSAEYLAGCKSVFSGMRLPCCHKEHIRAVLSSSMKGEGNNFFGKTHSLETREKISRHHLASPNHMRGKPRPQYVTDAIMRSIKGVPRTKSVRERLSAHMRKRHESFDYCVAKTLSGKTAGKSGWFYVVRIGEHLKFGSATTTMAYRVTRHKQKHGDDVELLMQCLVPDCGAYEAGMMQACRRHWSHGEFFHDFRGAQ